MIKRFLTKYITIVFVLATLMSAMHHHDDFKTHNDCQICTIQSNLNSGDMPTNLSYIEYIIWESFAIDTSFPNFDKNRIFTPLKARSPPVLSLLS